jgi:hypothetical protein
MTKKKKDKMKTLKKVLLNKYYVYEVIRNLKIHYEVYETFNNKYSLVFITNDFNKACNTLN